MSTTPRATVPPANSAISAAARRLAIPVVVGTDRCHRIEDAFGPTEGLLSIDYRRPEEAAGEIARDAAREPIAGVVPVDYGTAIIAALAAGRLPYTTGQVISADGGLLVSRF